MCSSDLGVRLGFIWFIIGGSAAFKVFPFWRGRRRWWGRELSLLFIIRWVCGLLCCRFDLFLWLLWLGWLIWNLRWFWWLLWAKTRCLQVSLWGNRVVPTIASTCFQMLNKAIHFFSPAKKTFRIINKNTNCLSSKSQKQLLRSFFQ